MARRSAGGPRYLDVVRRAVPDRRREDGNEQQRVRAARAVHELARQERDERVDELEAPERELRPGSQMAVTRSGSETRSFTRT